MRLTTFTDYSLRLLLYVAEAPEQRATIAEVAQAYGISGNHLTKIVHLLGKAGVLRNTRGRRGGVQLALPAAAINIGRVVRLTEGNDFPVECGDCVIRRGCGLIRVVHEAVDAFYAVLGRYTLADLAAESRLRVLFTLQEPSADPRARRRAPPLPRSA
jgi:Rrf2 family nitric oxide-sensitive transcriptional repressor